MDMNNRDITTITTEATGDSYAGKFKVLYPMESVQGGDRERSALLQHQRLSVRRLLRNLPGKGYLWKSAKLCR